MLILFLFFYTLFIRPCLAKNNVKGVQMKNIFFFVACLGLVSSGYAQESLFPQLNFQEEEAEEINAPTFVATEEKVIEEIQTEAPAPLVEATVEVQPAEVVAESDEEEDEEDEENEEEKVFIALTNVKTTVAAVKSVSYCSGDFMVFNSFKKRPVQELSVALKIGNTEKKFDFKNVAPKETTGKNFIMVGADCESILKVPPVDIQACKIKGIPDKKCKEKIEFIPIPQVNLNQNRV